MIPFSNDYLQKRWNTFLSLKKEESDDQPLDFSITKRSRDSSVPCLNYGLADIYPKSPASPKSPTNNGYNYPFLPKSPVSPKSPTRNGYNYPFLPKSPVSPKSPTSNGYNYPFLPKSPVSPKSPTRNGYNYPLRPKSPVNPKSSRRNGYNYPLRPKSPVKNSFHNNSRTSESGVSFGSISPEGSSPSQFPSNYLNPLNSSDYNDRNDFSGVRPGENDTNTHYQRAIFSMMGAPILHPVLDQPINFLAQTLANDVIARNSIAIMASLGKLPNFGPANLSVPPYSSPVGPNLMSVTQDHNLGCARYLQEKFHIPPSEMPQICTSHLDYMCHPDQINLISKINYEKFRDEVMLKKRDENPSKSRRAAARSTPYSIVRTGLIDESLDMNGESQGEPMETEIDPRKRQYMEKRRKNNEAAKKSRDQRKSKEEETCINAAFLEQENLCLHQLQAFMRACVRLNYNSPVQRQN